MSNKKVLAWYFAPNDNKLRYGDGRDIILGETHSVACTPLLCIRGLHASVNIMDALQYAPGDTLYRVELSGMMSVGTNKIAAQRRKYLWSVDTKELLGVFARKCALDVIHLWNAPEIVRQYLETGNKSISSAAWSAAWSAADSAAWSAADSAARSAARSAAWSAARGAARSAAWSAAWSAVRSAARSAADSAAWSAAESAAWSAQNKHLTELLESLAWEEQ